MEKKKKERRGSYRREELGFSTLHLLDLPIHLLSEIIARLPASSVIRCASVCSSLRALVSDPRFRHHYVSRAPTSFLLLSDKTRLLCLHSWGSASFLTPHSSSSLASIHPKQNRNRDRNGGWSTAKSRSKSKSSSMFGLKLKKDMELVNSSEGLVCLRGSWNIYYVCNPLLGEILQLPLPPTTVTASLLFSAFGYDTLNKRYKILQIASPFVTELYTLGDRTWTTIRTASALPAPRPDSSFDPSLNGALHWLAQPPITNFARLICSFDLRTHEFKWVPPPSYLDMDMDIDRITLGVFKGCLCLCVVVPLQNRFEMWFMQDYGVQDSWSRSFSIDINSYCGLRLLDRHRPIAFTNNGDMWLKDASASDSYSLVSYTPHTGSFKLIHTANVSPRMQAKAIPHVLSFVSLKDILNLSGTNLSMHRLTLKTYG